MSRTKLGAFFVASACLLLANAEPSSAIVINDPSSLNPAAVMIDFESIPVGTAEPIVVGGVTISTFNRESTNAPREVAPLRGVQHPGVFEGSYFGPGRQDYLIEFDTPVAQFGMGVHDPNFNGNALLAFDALGNLLEFALSAAGDPNFPTGPTGGSHSAFVGFVRPTADIARVELLHVFSLADGKSDLLAIDTVTFFPAGGTGAIPEPGSVVLLGIGCSALGLAGYRRRRSAA